MKSIAGSACSIVLVAALSGCATARRAAAPGALAGGPQAESPDRGRMRVRRAWLSLEVADVGNAVARVTDVAREAGGYVESRSDAGAVRADLTVRVPVDAMNPVMASLESVGRVTGRRVASQDVTGEYVDVDARRKTLVALRDRLRALLDKAEDVKDILSIEKELGRVQGEIDAMQARLQALKGQADRAALHLSIRRRRILGPLGYLLKGVGWTLGKLFVLRE